MSLQKYIERVQFIDQLIRKKATGNITVLAKKLNLSKSGAEKFIREMKEIGFPITYCKKRKTYLYEHEGKMVDKLFFEEMDNSEMKNVNGGKSFPDFFQFFSDRNYRRF
jgi:bacteriocin-like protein